MLVLCENRKKKLSLLYKNVKCLLPDGIQYRARRETGDSRAMTSIQDRQFRDFFVPRLFFVCTGRKLCGQNYDWEC